MKMKSTCHPLHRAVSLKVAKAHFAACKKRLEKLSK